jgi:hypothetical protein
MSQIDLIECDCPQDQEPKFRAGLVVSESIFFKGGDKYYKIDPDFDVIRGYAVDEEDQQGAMVLTKQKVAFIGKRLEFKTAGLNSYSVFEVNPEIAHLEGSGMIPIDGPKLGESQHVIKNSLTYENYKQIFDGHLFLLNRSRLLSLNHDPCYSFGIKQDQSPPIEHFLFLAKQQ